jgi:homoserine dehydrogenase
MFQRNIKAIDMDLQPDPREDLGGNDVGRKLLILARIRFAK